MKQSAVYAVRVGLILAACVTGWCCTSLRYSSVRSDEGLASANNSQSNGTSADSSLDFNVYRTRIELIFLKRRQQDIRCYDCHSVMNTRLKLQPLSSGASSWTEEQSKLNFEVVSKLVTSHQPMKSRLLLHPLAPEAGGDPTHTGGKFWTTPNDPEWQMIAEWVGSGSTNSNVNETEKSDASGDQGFSSYKVQVEPIFLKQRPGHARCYGCHSEGNRAFHLERLPAGSAEWAEEASRKNFKNVMQLVAPGDPLSSRLLMHPLAPESAGEPFHSGGRQFATQNDPDWLKMAAWVQGLKSSASVPRLPKVRIYITNSAGNTVDVVDPATNKIVQTIQGIELPHGVVFSPDGSRVYISNESESVLDIVDGDSGHILKKVPLTGHPNNLAITKDGKRILVGIREAVGALDVIDAATAKRIKSIPVSGPVHNVYVTPDGKYAVSGSIDAKNITVVDLQTDQKVWDLSLGTGVRPMAFDVNPDGSTNRIFSQLSGFNGFAVISFEKHAEIQRIKLPEQPGGYGIAEGRMGTPSHGIGITPDRKSLWIASTAANALFQYSLPALELIGHVELPVVRTLGIEKPTGSVPEWITFTPDNKTLYVSNSGDRSLSVVDTDARKIVAIVPVGEVPKRINTMVVH